MPEEFDPTQEVPDPVVEETPPEEPAATPDFIEFEGQQIPAEQFRTTARFMQWANQNPQAWNEMVEWEQGNRVLVPADQYQPVEDDPEAAQFTYDGDEDVDEFSRLEEGLRLVTTRLAELDQHTNYREELENRQAMQSGMAAFSEVHPELEEKDWEDILIAARDHNLVEQYLTRDPYNPVDAVKRAMDTAYRIQFFDRAGNQGTQQLLKDIDGKRRAAAASSNGASAPRTPAPPANDVERQEQIVKEIADAMASGE